MTSSSSSMAEGGMCILLVDKGALNWEDSAKFPVNPEAW